jgi:hypothetical protein
MHDIAPIGLSTYSRLSHLKRNIDALRKNTIAKFSDLYIFSDAPRKEDEAKVKKLRQYLKTIDGFNNITIFERKENNRVKNNRGGIKYLLDKFGKIIFLEEDIVTAPGFLQFINTALNHFKKSNDIFSITGYTPPINAHLYCNEDAFLLPRFSAWGFGIWKEQFDTIQYFDLNELKQSIKIKSNRQFVSDHIGEDAFLMMHLEAEGLIDALDVKAIYRQMLNRQFTVYPRYSLLQNIGHDGTGLHCSFTNKFDTKTWNKTYFDFNKNVTLNHKIFKMNSYFRKLEPKDKIIYLTKKLQIFNFLQSAKRFGLKKTNSK